MTIMAELWQFVSRSDMTRDNMSQALGAWGLGLGAFFHSCRRNIAPAQVQYFSQRFNFVTGLLYHLIRRAVRAFPDPRSIG
jgi:hypothetical protein